MVADEVGPWFVAGTGVTVSVKVVVAGAHPPPSLTVIVSVTVPPELISAALKLYVGVSVPALEIVPALPDVLLAVHVMVPLAAA